MIKHYWQFILGLQYNANLFLKNQIDYLQIQHDWSIHLHDLFLVRDFNTNALLYDSIDGLVISLYQQQFKQCSLYPFSILFNKDTLPTHPQFEFISSDYPIAVFQKNQKILALIQISEKCQSPEIQPIGDPREFWGATSSQNSNANFALFSLIELNHSQKTECFIFNKKLNYNMLCTQISAQLFNHQFTRYIYPQFEMINNLYLNQYKYHNSPLLKYDTYKPHIGLSLIQTLYNTQNTIQDLLHPKNECSPLIFFSEDDRTLFLKYRDQVDQSLIEIICFTANNMQYTEKINIQDLNALNEFYKQKKNEQYPINENPETEKTMTMLQALTTITIFLASLFCILYSFYWLMKHFEFIKFIMIILGLFSLLYLFNKKDR